MFGSRTGLTIGTLYMLMEQRFRDLNRYIDGRFAQREKHFDDLRTADARAITAALAAAEKAVTKAEAATEEHFKLVNGKDEINERERRTYIPRGESDAKTDALAKELGTQLLRGTALEARVSVLEGQGSGSHSVLGMMVSVVSVGVAIIMMVLYVIKK
jgi:hypothetical protein